VGAGADHLRLPLSVKPHRAGVVMQTRGPDPKFKPEDKVFRATRAVTQNLLLPEAVPVVAVEQRSPVRMDKELTVGLAELGDNLP